MRIAPSLRPGGNRTGLSAAAERRAMLAPPPELGPTARGTEEELARVRVRYARISQPAGTMPRVPHAAAELLPILDLLGGRLALARLAARLVDALRAARDASGEFDGGPDDRALAHLRDDHRRTARLVDGLIADLGADPTALTPSANRDLLVHRGIAELVHDPRTSLLDALDAHLVVELAEHDRWSSLIELAHATAADDLARLFASAQTAQQHHVSDLRRWVSAGWEAARRELRRGHD